jgi:hypothetical protein
MFPRGAEILTKNHLENNILKTENQNSNNIAMFDHSQQHVMNILKHNEPVNGVLSMKIDGMLVIITLYSGKLMEELLYHKDSDPFLNILYQLSLEYNCPFIPVISTQKTFNVTDINTIKYIVTSLLLTILPKDTIIEIKDMFKNCNKNICPYGLFKQYGGNLMKSLNILYNSNLNNHQQNTQCHGNEHYSERQQCQENEWISLCMEAVCPYRTCFWDIEHNEFAVNYTEGFCKILSYSVDLNTVPHFRFSQIIYEMGFDEPYWWTIDHSNTINIMLNNLSKFISNEIEAIDYITTLHPISNINIIHNSHIDPEGFVFWSISPDSKLDYHKIKTYEYYETHNPNNFKTLIDIASHTNVFPTATRVLTFFQNLPDRLLNVAICYRTIMNLDKDNTKIEFLNNLQPSPLDYILQGETYDNILNSYYNQNNVKIRCRMILNFGQRSIEIITQMFTHYFPEFRYIKNINNHIKILKKILVYIALFYLIWSIFVTVASVFSADKIECKYFQCNLIKFFNMDNLRDINNVSKQLNNSFYFGECYYKNERIDCKNVRINIFNRS